MDHLGWVIALALFALSVVIIIGNPIAGFIAQRRGRHFSFIPFVGGILGCIACLLCPVPAVRWFAWAPLVLDLSIPVFWYQVIAGKLRR